MELQCRKSTFVKKLDEKYTIGIPINSMDRFPRGILTHPASQFSVMPSPSNQYFKIGQSKADLAILRMKKLGEWMGNFTQGIREHVKLRPKFTETVKGKLRLGARILHVGGVEKVFKQIFNISHGEKLLKTSQCYLSTTTGLIAGLLFISTDKISFCSERSIELSSP
ncbi:Hypothetical predicted protein [Olea europaea subsp. europaea]|uniref:GRAM domain-containing protein n=1 Tax=Olea europaea subsp. europaea TaxID=158383 RepID=A0A8S0T7D3_OLEEU|nr:Hypothetical predicted protein [Olea europaea subsp. europaea]